MLASGSPSCIALANASCTGTWSMTCSTRGAAVCAMRRAPQNGQNPLRLQLKAKCLAHAPTDAFAAHEAEGEVGLAGDFAGCAGLTDEYLPDAKS